MVIIALSTKNKVEFVNGTTPQPSETDPSLSHWTRYNNNMVSSWLVQSVSVRIHQSIIWMDRVDIWNDLKASFSQMDLSRIFDL